MNWHHHSLPVLEGPPIDTYALKGAAHGPVVAILGGVHGDEPEGVFAARALIDMDVPLLRGEILVVPVAHPAAFAADTRCAPDGGNLARAFPGDPNGSPVERVAAALTSDILNRADVLIDLHTAGRDYDMPLLAGYIDTGDDAAKTGRHLAEQFGADFVWRHPHGNPGRSLSVMTERRKPAIYTEAKGGRLRKATVDRYVAGVRRCIAFLQMTEETLPSPAPRLDVTGAGNLDSDVMVASQPGYFTALIAAGDAVDDGEVLGQVMSLDQAPARVVAPYGGYVMYLRRRARVEAGSPLALLAKGDRTGAERTHPSDAEAVQ